MNLSAITDTTNNDNAQISMSASEKILFLPKNIPLPSMDDLPIFTDEFYRWKKAFWREKLRAINANPCCVAAPMVDQSELAFRMMMRSHGAHICYTPMIHAHLFVTDFTYRKLSFQSCKDDRPLIIQFCANDPATFLSACRLVEGYCDGVDLNLGCPQAIAKRGRYGAFLQEDLHLIQKMVSLVYRHCRLPLSVKIRRLATIEETVSYAKCLAGAGASLLTIHGRTRDQKGALTGIADWAFIRAVKSAIDIPVIANGNVQFPVDVLNCLQDTLADAVMSAEGILSNPRLFAATTTSGNDNDTFPKSFDIAREYLQFVKRFPTDVSIIRAHIFRFCHYSFLKYPDLRNRNAIVFSLNEFEAIFDELERRYLQEMSQISSDGNIYLEVNYQHKSPQSFINMVNSLPHYVCKPYTRPAPTRLVDGSNSFDSVSTHQNTPKTSICPNLKHSNSNACCNMNEAIMGTTPHPSESYREDRREYIESLSRETGLSKRCIKKREKKKLEVIRAQNSRPEYPRCEVCRQPASPHCEHVMCRKCCKFRCLRQILPGCKAHGFTKSKQQRSEEANA